MGAPHPLLLACHKTAHIQCGAPSQRTATIRDGASTTLLRRGENHLSYTKDKNRANGVPLEKFFQIFSHGRLAAFDGMANGALVHALLPGDLAVALAEDQMCLHPDTLHLRQRVEGVLKVDEFHAIQKLLRRRLIQAGRVFDPIITVEGILRLVAGRAPLIGCLIQLVRP